MNSKENLGLSGKLKLVLTDSKGVVKDERLLENLIVNAGLAHITSRMTAASADVMSHKALGSGTGSAAAGNTALGSQLGSRVAFTSATRSGSNNESIIYVTTFGAGVATGAVTEAGIFNAASSGTMLCRTVFAVVNKGSGDTLQVTWTVTLAAS
jgi:hypothetical protein|tara:strand:- start:152 stop:613 length:462 start_codon:yes stop_codon:yes gene_type:complete